jgi:hypothetical protein
MLVNAEETEQAMASRLRKTEFEAHAELLHVQQHARYNVEAMELVAHGQGITAAEARTACERVESEAEHSMRNAAMNFETMASDLHSAAADAMAVN